MANFSELSLESVKTIFSYLDDVDIAKICNLSQQTYSSWIKILLEKVRTNNNYTTNNTVKILYSNIIRHLFYSQKNNQIANMLNNNNENIQQTEIRTSNASENKEGKDGYRVLDKLMDHLNLIEYLNVLSVKANISLKSKLLLRTMSISLRNYFDNKDLPIKDVSFDQDTVYLLITSFIPQYQFLSFLGLFSKLPPEGKTLLVKELIRSCDFDKNAT